jgi:hypothetical protein
MTPQQWDKLARRALQAAEIAKDTRRARTIQAAIKTGNPSRALKRLGIICEADIQREFGRKT